MKIRKAYQGTVPENKILDTYSESQTDTYSCNYVNKYEEVVLYNNTTGTNETVNLSETSANFTYLEIFYRNNDQQYSSVKVYNPDGKYVSLLTTYIATNYYMMKGARIQIVADKINKLSYYEGNAFNQSTWTTNANNTYIVRVVGYK